MRRGLLVGLGAAGVLAAGIGVWMLPVRTPADFGWTAYATLSATAYAPGGTTPAGQVLAEVLLAIGAGTVGAVVAAWVVRQRGLLTRPGGPSAPAAAATSRAAPPRRRSRRAG